MKKAKVLKTTSFHAWSYPNNGNEKKYCSEICAEKYQMAHEL
ncbi:YdaE family protein [Escherichia coli]